MLKDKTVEQKDVLQVKQLQIHQTLDNRSSSSSARTGPLLSKGLPSRSLVLSIVSSFHPIPVKLSYVIHPPSLRYLKYLPSMRILNNIIIRLKLGNNKSSSRKVEQYKYLGTWVTDNGRCISEVKRRIAKAKDDFWKCKEFLRSNLNIDQKKKLLQTYICSIVSYGSETWIYNKSIESKIRTSEFCLEFA
ncbi:hypothetical protein GQR58_004758 [Nymphon striatum]|nr:hypothetical protein GQR58_004758 [Nymphon striatum]